jgi:hypothetical protein
MKPVHGIGLIVVLFLVYLLGAKFPSVGTSLLSKVGM